MLEYEDGNREMMRMTLGGGRGGAGIVMRLGMEAVVGKRWAGWSLRREWQVRSELRRPL